MSKTSRLPLQVGDHVGLFVRALRTEESLGLRAKTLCPSQCANEQTDVIADLEW
jgi:hypothetical protein